MKLKNYLKPFMQTPKNIFNLIGIWLLIIIIFIIGFSITFSPDPSKNWPIRLVGFFTVLGGIKKICESYNGKYFK